MLTTTRGSASTPSFTAVASAEQVYVLGLAPSAQASLITSSGHTLYTKDADSLGGLLFYEVPPGKGYRVRLDSDDTESGPLTVHSDAAAPWDPSTYKQSISENGYGLSAPPLFPSRTFTEFPTGLRLLFYSTAPPFARSPRPSNSLS
jgi:hypothetical protein